ncbi:MAG: GH3 auxin-responsive promoter family protein [Balneolaceae bacterium]|nr:GH3 auxin-responsive promoter family protein [Balneolaceae bacterium]
MTSTENDLKLITDNGIFYEFIADPLPDEESMSIQDTIPIWEVETGVPYAMVISTNAGLWRYAVRDIVEFTSVSPYRFEVKGRVSEMLDDYGEGLYIYEAEEALNKAAKQLGVQQSAFTIAPTLASESEVPFHHWFVQFTEPIHADTLKKMGKAIDEHLVEINRHDAIRRETEALSAPKVSSITQDDINRWMEASGKAKAQGKLPKVLRENVDVMG